MTYVLENINAKGQYLANDLDVALDSPLESGDVLKIEYAMKFKDEYDLMCWSADGGAHRAIMMMKFGKDAVITADIAKVLKQYRPKRIKQ